MWWVVFGFGCGLFAYLYMLGLGSVAFASGAGLVVWVTLVVGGFAVWFWIGGLWLGLGLCCFLLGSVLDYLWVLI